MRGIAGEFVVHEIAGPAISLPAVLWRAAHDNMAAKERVSGESKTGAAADEIDGFGSHLSQTPVESGKPRTPNLPVFIEGFEGFPSPSCVDNGQHLGSAAQRIPLSDGGDGLA